MNYDDVVLGRRSIRGFKREPVPKDVIRDVVNLAMRAPSSLNTQPWNFYVVAGERVLGYDNERGKGDHRHVRGTEEAIEFSSIDDLLKRFVAEVEAMRSEESDEEAGIGRW